MKKRFISPSVFSFLISYKWIFLVVILATLVFYLKPTYSFHGFDRSANERRPLVQFEFYSTLPNPQQGIAKETKQVVADNNPGLNQKMKKAIGDAQELERDIGNLAKQ